MKHFDPVWVAESRSQLGCGAHHRVQCYGELATLRGLGGESAHDEAGTSSESDSFPQVRTLLILGSLLVASGCQDADPEPQPVSCGDNTCGVAEYCSGLVCDDIAQRMGQCTTIGTTYACVVLPSSCTNDASCDCLMSLNELKNRPGATCVAPRTYTSLVF
jgi:hypothetical protein